MAKKKEKTGDKKRSKSIEFTNDEIQDLKDLQSENEIISDDEIENLKEMKKSISTNQVNLGILFTKCYDYLEVNISDLKNDDFDYSNKIEKIMSKVDPSEIRNLIGDYGFGKQFGDSLTEVKIKNILEKNRKGYLDLIKFFFQVFGGE